MGDDIDGFRRQLAGYKLTITIALTDANLRKSSVTAESLESFKDLLETASDDLQAHLEGINEKLEMVLKRAVPESSADSNELRLMKEERLSTQRCLQICDQLSEHISQIQIPPRPSASAAEAMGPDTTPESLINEGLQECQTNLTVTVAKLETHMKKLTERLVAKSKAGVVSEDEAADLTRLYDEWETARQCINICSKADGHLKENISIIDNYATGDAIQFMVSTNGKILHATMQTCQTSTGALRAARLSPKFSTGVQCRNLQDVSITRTGKPIIRVQGGRSSLGGNTATVFGATGFLGRYIVNRLARRGCNVVVPYREEMAKRHLKPTGDLGRVTFMEFDLRNTASIEESVRHSDLVFNLVGRMYPTKNFSLWDVHVEGTERIAEAAAKYDCDRFIQVSSYNADPNSPAEFFRTKAEGERVARTLFPETTIVRPAPLFGFEDHLLHRLAGVTNILTVNHMQERFWPVHVIDVGKALDRIALDDTTAGETFELYGPTNYSMAEIAALVDREIIHERRHINVPKAILKPIAYYLNRLLWWPVMSADELEVECLDQHIDKSAKTLVDLGIEPAELASLTYHYLQDYRGSSYYNLPPATARERSEERKYLHVIDDQ
ncbi:hypothetical protein DV736_g4683, partial [Chaetothyriales sp. CBS 134916]